MGDNIEMDLKEVEWEFHKMQGTLGQAEGISSCPRMTSVACR